MEGNIAFISLERIFATLIYYVTTVILTAGIELGATKINHYNGAQFGVQVLFILRLLHSVQYLLRQIINSESLMISAERAFQITELPPEK